MAKPVPIETRLEQGGYVSRGRKAEDGRINDRYKLIELSTSSYQMLPSIKRTMLACMGRLRLKNNTSGGTGGERAKIYSNISYAMLTGQ